MAYKNLPTEYSSQGSGTGATLYIESMVNGVVVDFPAFLTSLSQNFKSEWQSEKVFGRNDPIGTFAHTTRTVTLGWVVPAASLKEAKNNEIKISNLISFLYPGYSEYTPVDDSGNTITSQDGQVRKNLIMSRSPLVKVKFSNIIQAQDGSGLLGWIDGVDWKPKLDSGMFTESGNFYAKIIELNVTLNVLHQQDLGYNQTNKWLGNNKKFPFKLE